jgi:eukaryotic-like serine/threonine-protein kinase
MRDADDDEGFDALLRAVAESPEVALGCGVGSELGERFVLLRRLGAGTFGVVYEAEDRRRGVRVALKMLRTARPAWIDRFKREVRAMRHVKHRNLVALGDLYCLENRWFFTMELLEGVDLVCAVRERATPRRIRGLLAQLVDGLAAFHARGRVHRDIKPSNVIVTTDEQRVVVIDFGLSARVGEAVASDIVVGTPAYMAPEQAAGRRVTPAADMYAVGVLLYEMLYRRRPVAGDVEPRTREVPCDLATLCEELRAAEPARRPSARQVKARLELMRRVQPATGATFDGGGG